MSLNDFEFGKELGKGAFGSVTIVKRKEDNKIYAMKRVKIGRLGKKEKDNSFNEVRLLASLEHKNIIGYKEAFFDDRSKTLNIVMEYADGGDLSTKIKEYRKKNSYFEEAKIWSTLIQILEGLKYLHQSHIIHRDLKSANIFLTKNGCIKIGDLNVSKILNRMCTASTQTGTPYFASPEIWNDQPYDYKCDIWSVGCIIYEMASLHVPFRGTSMQNLYQNVLRGIYQQIPMNYSDDLRKIINQILIVNPKKRPSSSELLENPIIKHKIIELGLNKDNKNKNDEKAKLMKTIKIPINMSQINMELPQKKYEKEKMLLNDEYETAKRTFYHPPPVINDDNNNNNINNLNEMQNKQDNILDKNKINDKNNKDNLLYKNANDNIIKNNNIEEKNFIEQLLGKDLNKIQNIIKNIDNSSKYMLNNYNNNNIKENNLIKNNQKSLKNIDNNEEVTKNSILIKRGIGTIPESKQINLENPNQIELIKYSPKIRENIYNNKYSNINYDYILNEQDNINRIIKTDMNQINNNINLNNPFTKNEEIIKTEISNIDKSFKNNNKLQSEENNNNIWNFDIEKSKEKDNKNIKDNVNNVNNIEKADNLKNNEDIQIKNVNQDNNDFKEKFNKLMEELNQKPKLKEENIINKNNNNFIKKNNFVKNIKIEDIDEEILKSKKELDEIDRNLNLLVQKSRHKKELKSNKSENLLNSNLNININNNKKYKDVVSRMTYNVSEINLTENRPSNNNGRKSEKLMYRQKQIKKINNQDFDINFKNIRNNRQPLYNNKHNISLRPYFKNDLSNERSYLNVNNKSNINKSKNKQDNGQGQIRSNNNSNRYNIFINYKNDNNNNNNNNNYKNNYYFNNCNFINNNNENNYHYKYNNNNMNYLRNPNNNNYYNYNQYYKEYFNNFMNHLLKKQKEENNINSINKYENNNYNNKNSKDYYIKDNINKNKNNNNNIRLSQPRDKPYLISNKFIINNENDEKNKRKVIYEKINFQKQGNKYKYFKGPSQVRYVGNGNYYNQCHKAIIKSPVIINPSKQFGIQNLLLSGTKQNRGGPRIIVPNKMFE